MKQCQPPELPPVARHLAELGAHLVEAQEALYGRRARHPLGQPVEGGRDQLQRPDEAGEEDQRQRGDEHYLGRQVATGKQGPQHHPEPGGGQQEGQGEQPQGGRLCGAGYAVIVEAEAEEVGHRQHEQPPHHQGAGQQQRQHGRLLPIAVLPSPASLVLGRPQNAGAHQQHLVQDQHEDRRHHVVHIAHGRIEHRHHVEPDRIPAHGSLGQRLAVAQQPGHLDLSGQGAARLGQPLGDGAVNQEVRGVAGITQGDALAQHQITVEMTGNVQYAARLAGQQPLPRLCQAVDPSHQFHLGRRIGHELQLTGELAAVIVDHHHSLFARQLMQIGLRIEEGVEEDATKQGQHDGPVRQQSAQLETHQIPETHHDLDSSWLGAAVAWG